MRPRLLIPAALALSCGAATIGMTRTGEQVQDRDRSTVMALPYDNGIVDLSVSGPAAQTLYDRLPGSGEEEEKNGCGSTGLHKGSGRIHCVNRDEQYSCNIWLDASKEALTEPETDDC